MHSLSNKVGNVVWHHSRSRGGTGTHKQFLKPIVDDLMHLYEGIEIRSVVTQEESFTSRDVLLPVPGDIPASIRVLQYPSF